MRRDCQQVQEAADLSGESITIVYGTSISPFVRKVLVALAEKGNRYEHRPVSPQAEDAAFRAASPVGKIPTIEHDGFRLADSRAIFDNLERLYPQPALIPADAQGGARARWFEQFGAIELDRRLSVVFAERFLKPRIFKVPGDEALAQQALDTHLPPLFDSLDSRIAGPFLVGGAFGIADIAVAAPFHNLRLAQVEVSAARWPKLAGWVARTLDWASFVTAITAPAG